MDLNKIKYVFFKAIARKDYISTRDFLNISDGWDGEQINFYQDKMISNVIDYSYNNIPYYGGLLKSLGLSPEDFKSKKDLLRLPILTKDIIKDNYDLFYPVGMKIPFRNCSTGGSTGVPLKYRLSNQSALYASLLLDRGLGKGGYMPGEKMAIVAGGSLTGKKKTIKNHLIELLSNYRYFSSYGMDEVTLDNYAKQLIRYQPTYLRGYASALGALANYMQANGMAKRLHLKSVFSTSEMLSKNVRENIEQVFQCDVYDTWGLNDGGASAFECRYHNGMHIDIERGFIEIIPDSELRDDRYGRVIVTSLIDKSMPLIRYDTGDLGRLDSTICQCGCKRPRLFLNAGRTTDYIKINNKIIGAPVLTVLMGAINANQYQIAKISENSLVVRIVKGRGFSSYDHDYIIRSLSERVGFIDIKIEYHNTLIPKCGNKHRFIIDETL